MCPLVLRPVFEEPGRSEASIPHLLEGCAQQTRSILLSEELLEGLTTKSRLISDKQLDDCHHRRHSRELLVKNGWMDRINVYVRELPRLERPLVSWSPGDAEPDFASPAYRARSRWRGQPRMIGAYVATKKAGTLFGGRGGPLANVLQAEHDLALTATYLFYRVKHPELAQKWLAEDILQFQLCLPVCRARCR
jgi:hypothetical protein